MTQRPPTASEPRWTDNNTPSLGAGHLRAADAYQDVPILKRPLWANEVTTYFYLGGISSGAFLVGAVADLFGSPRLSTFARRAHIVALLTALPCAPLLILDLGRPTRFLHMLRVFKPGSPMNLGAWTLVGHSAISSLIVLRFLLERLPILGVLARLVPQRLLSLLGLGPALTLGGYTGVLLGTSATPVWSTSPLLGALFTASAVTTGSAAAGLANGLAGPKTVEEEKMLCHLGAAAGVAELGLLRGFLATSGEEAKPLRQGRFRLLLRGATLLTLLGVLLDLASLAAGGSTRRSVAASISTLAGGALLRWAIVFAGRPSAEDRAGYLLHTRPAADRPGWTGPDFS